MSESNRNYYYIDVDLDTKTIISCEVAPKTQVLLLQPEKQHHRVFLTKGQYNKLVKALSHSPRHFR